MRHAGRGRGCIWIAIAVLCAFGAAAQQAAEIRGVVHKVGGSPVGQAEVRIEGEDYSVLTTDSGNFKLKMGANLHVGMLAVFQVRDWVILQPCDLRNGRTTLRDPSAEPIELLVLKQGDPQLISVKKNLSIIRCLLEEQSSQFTSRAKPASGPRSALPEAPNSLFGPKGDESAANTNRKTGMAPPYYHLVEAAYHPDPPQRQTLPSRALPSGTESSENDQFLAKKARELGFTVAELKSAISEWGKSADDPYDKGLVALQELRYAEASRYISASIPSPPGALVDRYVPLARAEYEQGHYAAAESALRKVLAVHSDDPIVLNNLAVALAAQAKNSEAEPLYKRALAIDEKILGPDHPAVATVLNNLGLLYFHEANSEAEALYKRALAIYEKALGPDDSGVATVLNNLGYLYFTYGKYGEAEPLYKRALAINEKALGPDHPMVANNLSNLGWLYQVEGKYGEAEPLYKRALAIDEKVLGPDHPSVAALLIMLGLLYGEEGKYDQLEPLNKRLLAIHEKTLGPDDPVVAYDLIALGSLYNDQGKYSEAEPLYKRALAIDEKALGPDHPKVAMDLNSLGLLYKEQGRYSEAEPLYKRALEIDEKVAGPDHPAVAPALGNLALLYLAQGKYSEAEALYKRVLAMPDNPDVAVALNNLASLYEAQGKYSEAEPLYKRALAIDEQVLGPNHPTVATNAESLAINLRKQGRDKEAEVYEQQAAKIRAMQKQK